MATENNNNAGKSLIGDSKVITMESITDLLLREGAMTLTQKKEVIVKERPQRARLAKQLREVQFVRKGRPQVQTSLSPIEVLASFQLPMPDSGGKLLLEDRIMQALAKDLGMEFVKIDPTKLDMDLVTRTISRAFARRHRMVPIGQEEDTLLVAVDDPFDQEGLDLIRQATKKKLKLALSSPSDIRKIISEFYGFRSSVVRAEQELQPGAEIQNLEQFVAMKSDGFDAQDAPIIQAVEYLFRYAYEQRASDIHVEPKRDSSLVRFRIDGILHDIHKVPRVVHQAVVSRIKMLSRMDIAEKRRPQDGRIKTEYRDKEVELRVSTMPVAFGEKVVVRIFDPEVLMQDLTELGFYEREFKLFNEFISRPNGMILVTGPTGSGKTTTLYSALRAVSSPDINIVTIEDPIEMIYEEFNQVGVQPRIDVTFASALRTILRQDPDVIMVGEIRDHETAANAVQSALTGHLVLSTLHTNDSATAVTRLSELEIEAFLIASTVVGVMAQRLVRKICPHCKTETFLGADELRALRIPVKDEKQRVKVWYGAGCLDCRSTGYFGRTGIFEVLPVSPKVMKLIRDNADAARIQKAAQEEGMMLLREVAIKKLGEGVTTFDEVVRVTAL
ncbi:MAG TPA: GspE/PulE family protein [bacterium]|nr:GspE/PulE family protein [bacterium]